MGVYRLSTESENDIAGIYEYGIEKFGILQAQNYLFGMHDLFQTLAKNPGIGRAGCIRIFTFIKRFTCKSHMVFYLNIDPGILIIRVLHSHSIFAASFKDILTSLPA